MGCQRPGHSEHWFVPAHRSGVHDHQWSEQLERYTLSDSHGAKWVQQSHFLAKHNDQGAAIFDRLFIEVRSTTGTLLATLATFSNQNSGTAGNYILRGPYNLSSFAGQTVRIQFRGTNDITLPTSFRIDDVAVQ